MDGKKVGSVKDGATVKILLPTGSHEVRTKIDWKKSNIAKIRIEAGITTRIRVGYKKKEGWRLFVPLALSLMTVITGAAFGIGMISAIGIFGILLTRVGNLYLENDKGHNQSGSLSVSDLTFEHLMAQLPYAP